VVRFVKINEVRHHSSPVSSVELNIERWINPEHVAHLCECEGGTYVDLTDGSSFRVRGTPQDVMRLLGG
jgi:hypothetical protein